MEDKGGDSTCYALVGISEVGRVRVTHMQRPDMGNRDTPFQIGMWSQGVVTWRKIAPGDCSCGWIYFLEVPIGTLRTVPVQYCEYPKTKRSRNPLGRRGV
jgi:hypothetical protein